MKQLTSQLEAAFAEIERLTALYRKGIERLELSTVANLSADDAAHWFRTYLRLVDIGVEIRRGERRHRSSREIQFQCLHTTGTKGAQHTGLSIDDANAIFRLLEATPGMKSSRLDVYFMRMDLADRDGVGVLDIRLNGCLTAFLRLSSAFYRRLEVNGSDPHQEMLIHPSNQIGRVLKVTRVCFHPIVCVCAVDAQPWLGFTLQPSSVSNGSYMEALGSTRDGTYDSTGDDASTELGLAELKRQYGFEAPVGVDNEEHEALLQQKRRRLGVITQARAAPPVRAVPPREIYRRKCQERGTPRKRKIDELFMTKQGGLELNLSEFGFHQSQDLQDVLEVIQEAQVPVLLLDVTNNFFDVQSFDIFCDLLRLPLLRQHLHTLRLRCMALPQRPDFASLLRILIDSDLDAMDQLVTLDLSYNTFFEDAVLSINDLLDGLCKLESLSLESCFPKAPDPAVVQVAVVKDMVRFALVACSHRLKRLNFGSNWMSFPLLNSLFAPDSALETLEIAQMTFFYFDAPDTTPISWRFGFERQRTITLSETKQSRGEYLPFFLDALTYSLKMQLAPFERLDISLLPPHQRKPDPLTLPDQQLGYRVAGLLDAIAEYGKIKMLRLRYDMQSDDAQGQVAIARLMREGLEHCEVLELALYVPLTVSDCRGMLEHLSAPQLKTLKLSLTLQSIASSSGNPPHSTPSNAFELAFKPLRELTLEFRVGAQAKAQVPEAFVREMENAWRASSSTGETREIAVVKRKTRKERGSSEAGRMTIAILFTTITKT
ncbi:hypothetical protein Poli38472_007918 [Pythium oligandrum]|uniref:Uncharacterized protein n=1 Tax=Pythium oligandrum TaxID=41045 RepID=A0A8K1CMA2_PYTOL|nr:hypothetical protein Poli38472_007918 [Pythium oligandrum]|eukprot:TMW65276.1 hypothetical protein Poli38472_007918 [Pythium oligandrum]